MGGAIQEIGGKSSDLHFRRIELYQLKEESSTKSWGRDLSLHGNDS
jgi:hypothetical protein